MNGTQVNGYGILTILDKTNLIWRQYDSKMNTIIDQIVIHKD